MGWATKYLFWTPEVTRAAALLSRKRGKRRSSRAAAQRRVASMIPSSGFKLGPGALEGSLKIS